MLDTNMANQRPPVSYEKTISGGPDENQRSRSANSRKRNGQQALTRPMFVFTKLGDNAPLLLKEFLYLLSKESNKRGISPIDSLFTLQTSLHQSVVTYVCVAHTVFFSTLHRDLFAKFHTDYCDCFQMGV